MENRYRLFEEPQIAAIVSIAGKEEFLAIDEKGVLELQRIPYQGFNLTLCVKPSVIVTQRDLARKHGNYLASHLMSVAPALNLGPDFCVWTTASPIPVIRAGQQVWTPWKGNPGQPANKVDCWMLDPEGKLDLFQIGIITHNDGKTFHLLGEYAWRGQMFQIFRAKYPEGFVGKPHDPKWGSFAVRKEILRNPILQRQLDPKVRRNAGLPPLPLWTEKDEELDPPLSPIPEDSPEEKFARVKFYKVFAGQTGWGVAVLRSGAEAQFHGTDVLSAPDTDEIKRFSRDDLISYGGTADFGNQIRLLMVERKET